MGKQIFNIKGITQDVAAAKFSEKYAYEIRNLRLTAQEGNTLLSLTTEKGNLKYTLDGSINGTIVGYCVLGDYLVLFSHDATDYIYRLVNSDSTSFTVLKLYEGDLGFSNNSVLETKGVYENANIQKVYWIDGEHQPRFINIVADEDTRAAWLTRSNPFDFTPTMSLEEDVEISKIDINGMFPAGTIQYILTYYNRNGQQSASFYQSPIFYTAKSTRGASPEESVSNAFQIEVENPDESFDYLRIYSVLRTSENGTPECKKVYDLPLSTIQTKEVSVSRYTVTLGNRILETSQRLYDVSSSSIHILKKTTDSSGFNTEEALDKFFVSREETTNTYHIPSDYYVVIQDTSSTEIFGLTTLQGKYLTLLTGVGNTSSTISVTVGNFDASRQIPIEYTHWGSSTVTLDTNLNDTTKYLSYIDTGFAGETVDYSEILYAGGNPIVPYTMEAKSNTLFFGNYSSNYTLTEENKTVIGENAIITFGYSETEIPKGTTGSYYMYKSQLDYSAKDFTTFKGGETYTFGIILQDSLGQWTDVIPIGSKQNILYPQDSTESFKPVKAFIEFTSSAINIIRNYKRIKVVLLQDTPRVVCQGALCPTVFNKKRKDNLPYAMSSWFFRPIPKDFTLSNHRIQAFHDANIQQSATLENVDEIQGASIDRIIYSDLSDTEIENLNDTDFFVDWNILTLHSPDIEFGNHYDFGYKMRLVGILPITASRSSMYLSWNTPPRNTTINHWTYTPIVENNISTDGYKEDLSLYEFIDNKSNTASDGTVANPVYPWHRNGSLTYQTTPSGSEPWYAFLDTKIMASLRESAATNYFDNILGEVSLNYDITDVQIYQNDDQALLIPADENQPYKSERSYMASIDTALTNSAYTTFYKLNDSIVDVGVNTNEAIRMKYKSSTHGVFSLIGALNKTLILPNVPSSASTFTPCYSHITPSGTITTLNTSGTGITYNSIYQTMTVNSLVDEWRGLEVGSIVIFTNYSESRVNTWLWVLSAKSSSRMMFTRIRESEWIQTHTLGTRILQSRTSTGVYTYRIYFKEALSTGITNYYYLEYTVETVTEVTEGTEEQETITYDVYDTDSKFTKLPSESSSSTNILIQRELDCDYANSIYIAELFADSVKSIDYKDGTWVVASDSQKIAIDDTNTIHGCVANIGDTYYQRYDCLKTYPYTNEDQNQIVEIFSFMCETRVNLDGRYDNKRGLADNTIITGTNFNLINKAYTQQDNFFTYNYLDSEDFNITDFPTQLIWTQSKVYGSKIDQWTEIIPLSTLDVDGSLGPITSLNLWNDNLICFQDKGISRINYNEKVTLSTEQGVPVELANSGKVDGNTYISTQVGCKNKQSIQVTSAGMYFIDSNNKEFYKLSQGLDAVSKNKGMNSYFYNANLDTVKAFFDPKLKDIYLKFDNDCLVYSEQFEEFVGFFDYSDMNFLFPLQDQLVTIKDNTLWKQFAGNKLSFFGTNKGYDITLISAENPTVDKVFTNVEIKADVKPQPASSSYASPNEMPFDKIQAWNDYQETDNTDFVRMLRKGVNMSQKFRLWRADIPRVTHIERMRDTWVKIKLSKNAGNFDTKIDNIGVVYF